MEEIIKAAHEENSINLTDVEIMTMKDERIRLIGEVLADNTEREIFSEVYKGSDTASEISKALQLDLGLVVRHLNKLFRIGMVTVSRVRSSQKGRPVKVYTPSRTVLIVVPNALIKKFGQEQVIRSLINALLLKLYFCHSHYYNL